MHEYLYKNKLAFCPNCGAALKNTDLVCPACSINLAGYNEKHNRLSNLQHSEKQIVEQKQIQEQIETQNKKNIKGRSRTPLFIFLGIVAGFIIMDKAFDIAVNKYYSSTIKDKHYDYGYLVTEETNIDDFFKEEADVIEIQALTQEKEWDYKILEEKKLKLTMEILQLKRILMIKMR